MPNEEDYNLLRFRRLSNPFRPVNPLPQGEVNPNELNFGAQPLRPSANPAMGMLSAPPVGPKPTRQNILNAPDTGLLSLRNRPKALQEEYQTYLRGVPNRKDYQLGNIGKALSLASGVIEGGLSKSPTQGVELGMALQERPYRTALEEHAIKGQGLKEQVALERQGFEDELKIAEEERQRFAAISDALYKGSQIDWNDARIKDIEAKGKYAGWEFRDNKQTGNLEAVNLDGRRMPIAKFFETYDEAEKRGQTHEEFLQANRLELGVQRGEQDIALEDRRQIGRLELQAQRGIDAKDLERLKASLAKDAGMNNTQQNAAIEGAYRETFMANPGLVDLLFKQDEAGNWIRKTTAEGFDPDAYKLFVEKYEQRLNNRLGKNQENVNMDQFYIGQESVLPGAPKIGTGPPQVSMPSQAMPQVTIPNNYTNPNAFMVPPEEPDPYAPLPEGIPQAGAPNPLAVPSSTQQRTPTPQVTAPQDMVFRNAATEYIRRNYADNPELMQDEGLIQEVMAAIKARAGTDNPLMLQDPDNKQAPLPLNRPTNRPTPPLIGGPPQPSFNPSNRTPNAINPGTTISNWFGNRYNPKVTKPAKKSRPKGLTLNDRYSQDR